MKTSDWNRYIERVRSLGFMRIREHEIIEILRDAILCEGDHTRIWKDRAEALAKESNRMLLFRAWEREDRTDSQEKELELEE